MTFSLSACPQTSHGSSGSIDDPNKLLGFELSGSSIETELPCDVCGQADRENVMVVCDGCKHGLHIACLEPILAAVPEGY